MKKFKEYLKENLNEMVLGDDSGSTMHVSKPNLIDELNIISSKIENTIRSQKKWIKNGNFKSSDDGKEELKRANAQLKDSEKFLSIINKSKSELEAIE